MENEGDEVFLPPELWMNIFSYLDYPSLIRCGQVNHQLHYAATHDSNWRRLCKKYWLLSSCEASTWKETFENYYKEYGRYIHCYATIKKAWMQILNFVNKNCPEIHDTVKEGVSEEQLGLAELILGVPLPDDLRCSFRIHNGQRMTSYGLLGSMSIPDHHRSEILLDLPTALRGFQERRNCLPLTLCVNTGTGQYISLSDCKGLPKERVFYTSGPNRIQNHVFLSAENFTTWFTSYAKALQDEEYPVIEKQPFRFVHEKNCVATTGSIKVEVATSFLPELSSVDDSKYFFTYRITMSMAANAKRYDSCQLSKRSWIITDGDRFQTSLVGSGVVGEYPIMRPGASYSWVSCNVFNMPYGNMRGEFTMRLLKTGDIVTVECPVFHMKSLPYLTVPSLKALYENEAKRPRHATDDSAS